MKALNIILCHKAEIKVTAIVINCTAPGDTPYNVNIVCFDVVRIDFFNCVLMFADYNGRFIDVKKQVILSLKVEIAYTIFLKSKINRRIVNVFIIY